ncbi:MAG TPA: TlpA family protein disulfide reductase [Stenotrophobium sp.]|nr:TlpA family protein disulfide reductase [Stenotrophobium sp.]
MNDDGGMMAPELDVTEWLNTVESPTLASQRGKVVALHAFQMLCPGCVLHGVPQAQKLHDYFPHDQVAVLGLHTVFEHHAAMQAESLRAFLYEFRVRFPVGIDRPSADSPIPATMQRYAMQGTPTLVLIDRKGRLREQWFGQVEDLAVGARIAGLLAEAA